MRRWNCFLGILALATPAFGALSYHETWDVYAAGTSDPTYNAVWKLDPNVGSGEYMNIQTTDIFTAPHSTQILGQNRAMDNDLTDGITNTGIGGTGFEMNPGETVNGVGALGDVGNLLLGLYHFISTANQRQHISAYVEISLNGQHAPDPSNFASYGLTGPLDTLPAPIPVIAVGKLNPQFTGLNSQGNTSGQNNSLWWFNGQEWIRTALGATTGYNRYWLDLGTTDARIREDNQGISSADIGDRMYLGGFNTISWRYFDSNDFSGRSAGDDIYLTNGVVIPEPAAIALLGMGLTLAAGRRRR